MNQDQIEQTIGGRIRLDAITLDHRAAHLPEKMRDRFVWLGSYLRDECAYNMDILTSRFKALKIDHDKTTWGKILRGLWDKNADGTPSNSPCLSEAKFCQAVDQLKNDALIKEQGGRIPFVKTAVAERIFNYIKLKRTPDRVNKFGVIIGETGSQKTSSLVQYCSENNHYTCVRVEAPERPSMSQFMTDLARAYGYSEQSSYGKKKAFVLEAVTNKRTIIVENVQRLYDERYKDKQPIFSFLQKLQEDTGCTVIMSATGDFARKMKDAMNEGFLEQFAGRCGGPHEFLELPKHAPEEDVLMIAEAFKLRDAQRHLKELCAISQMYGRIRVLFRALQKAQLRAKARGNALNIEHVREVVKDSKFEMKDQA